MLKTDNFIGICENLYTEDECNLLIDFFEKAGELGLSFSRQKVNDMEAHQKSDDAVAATEIFHRVNPGSSALGNFTKKFWPNVFDPYVETYSVLKFVGQMGIISAKIQKTLPGQGYHIWHFENDSIKNSNRLMTFITYLNDVEEGGETEFLYLGKRIKPTRGTTLLFPAGYSHTHRGNPPLSGEKYIFTGWIEWCGIN